jgi:hypothetical protein
VKRLIVAGLTGYVIGLKLVSWAVRGAMEAARTIGHSPGDDPMTLADFGRVRIVQGDADSDNEFLERLARRMATQRKAVLN